MPECKQKRNLLNLVLLSEGNTCAERCCTRNDHELIMTDTTDITQISDANLTVQQ